MKTLYGIAHNITLIQTEAGKTIPSAEIVLTLMEPEYQATPNDPEHKAQRVIQYQTIRFHAEARQCSETASALNQIGQQLHDLSQTQGNTIALAGENKVLRDILAEAQAYIEEDAPGDADAAKLLQIIQAARTGRA